LACEIDILIYGSTEIGFLIASQLHQQHNVTVLSDSRELNEKFNNLDITISEGSGVDITVLEKNGAAKAKIFIACSALDEANVVACWTIKKIADTETICFIRKPTLYRNLSSSAHNHYQTRYDIDSIIWPAQLLTQDIFRIISVPDALDVEFLAGGKAKLFEYRIKDTSIIINKPIVACNFPKDVLIAGITREGNRLQVHNVDIIALIEGGKGEVMRLTIPETFKEVRIMDFKLPVNAIIGVITRGHRLLIPNGNTLICPDDRLKIFTMKEDSENIKRRFFP